MWPAVRQPNLKRLSSGGETDKCSATTERTRWPVSVRSASSRWAAPNGYNRTSMIWCGLRLPVYRMRSFQLTHMGPTCRAPHVVRWSPVATHSTHASFDSFFTSVSALWRLHRPSVTDLSKIDLRTQVPSAHSSLVVTHPSTRRGRRVLTSVNVHVLWRMPITRAPADLMANCCRLQANTHCNSCQRGEFFVWLSNFECYVKIKLVKYNAGKILAQLVLACSRCFFWLHSEMWWRR